MSTKLDQARQRIDEIDAEITQLFETRFELLRDIIEYKIENRIPIFDASREEKIIGRNIALLKDDDIEPYFEDFYRHMIDLSKSFQKSVLDEK